MRKAKIEFAIRIMIIVLTGATLLSFAKGIFISLDIDESYAVASGYRLAHGDKLIKDMWEPHQFSAFLAAFFIAPYIWLRGNTDYLVIYLRIISVLIHSLFGFALYKQLSKDMNKSFVFFVVLLHLNYLPKWIQTPEFELIHYWCLLGIFLTFHAYFTNQKRHFLFPMIAGCFLAGCVLCYPTMVLLYPFYILAIILMERRYFGAHGWNIGKSCISFTFGSALIGAILLAYLFRYMSLNEFLRYINYIFLDTSHTIYTMSEKWAFYLEQLLEQGNDYIYYLLPAAGLTLAIYLAYRIVSHHDSRIEKESPTSISIMFLLVTALLMAALSMQITGNYSFLFDDKNQFFFQIRYIAILLPALLLGIRYYKEMSIWLHLCIIPGLISVIAVLFVTNMDTNVTYAKAYLGVLGSFLIFYQYSNKLINGHFSQKLFRFLHHATICMVLAGLLICRLLLIRVTGCLPVTILAPLEKMEYGPAKGIYILADTARIWNDNYPELDSYVNKDDKVLYIGSENLIYVGMEALLATPSTQGTLVYNDMFLYYYREHPERIPNVIIFDKSFTESPAYSQSYTLSLQNPLFLEWLRENYRDGQQIETEHMILLRKDIVNTTFSIE